MLLDRYGQSPESFGLEEIEASVLRSIGCPAYRFTTSTGRQDVLRWWAGQRKQDVAEKFSICRDVGNAGFDEIIETAGHHVTFQNFWCAANGGRKLVENIRRRFVERDFDKNKQWQIDEMRV